MLYCNRIIIERKILHQLPTQHDYQSYINGWLCIHHIHEIQIKLASLDSFKKFSYIIVVPCFYNFDCWFTFMEWPIKLFNVSALIFVVNTIFSVWFQFFIWHGHQSKFASLKKNIKLANMSIKRNNNKE